MRPEEPKIEAESRERGVGSLGSGQQAPPQQLGGLKERCEFPQRGLGRRPDRPKVFHYFHHSGWPLPIGLL